ncbi:unnamed protein product, partial [Rotaria sp. Silwood1]
MASNGTPPSQSLINAAVRSLFAVVGGAIFGLLGVPIAATGLGIAALSLISVNLIKLYESLVPAVSGTGENIPREFLKGPLAITTDCLEPEFDCDFTNICDDGKTFRRGNQPYERPCGSYRIVLKVKDKFGTDNVWLGMKGDEPYEWLISYH